MKMWADDGEAEAGGLEKIAGDALNVAHSHSVDAFQYLLEWADPSNVYH